MDKVKIAGDLLCSLLLGGVLALFVQELYRRFSRSLSNRESFSAVFMPLTISTVLVISVIKSSLALSLGLVGALSIVRFRAAIKDPEELVYLFFCIALGLTLGAERFVEAFVGFFVFTFLIITVHFIVLGRRKQHHNLLLTITGKENDFFGDDMTQLPTMINKIVGPTQIQRFEYDEGQVQFRATISSDNGEDIIAIMAKLQKKLPKCQVSYVNLNNLL